MYANRSLFPSLVSAVLGLSFFAVLTSINTQKLSVYHHLDLSIPLDLPCLSIFGMADFGLEHVNMLTAHGCSQHVCISSFICALLFLLHSLTPHLSLVSATRHRRRTVPWNPFPHFSSLFSIFLHTQFPLTSLFLLLCCLISLSYPEWLISAPWFRNCLLLST